MTDYKDVSYYIPDLGYEIADAVSYGSYSNVSDEALEQIARDLAHDLERNDDIWDECDEDETYEIVMLVNGGQRCRFHVWFSWKRVFHSRRCNSMR